MHRHTTYSIHSTHTLSHKKRLHWFWNDDRCAWDRKKGQVKENKQRENERRANDGKIMIFEKQNNVFIVCVHQNNCIGLCCAVMRPILIEFLTWQTAVWHVRPILTDWKRVHLTHQRFCIMHVHVLVLLLACTHTSRQHHLQYLWFFYTIDSFTSIQIARHWCIHILILLRLIFFLNFHFYSLITS